MITILSSLLFSCLFSKAIDLDVVIEPYKKEFERSEPFPHKEAVHAQMQEIYVKMAKGTLPELSTEKEFYSGLCITAYSAAPVQQTFSATVALNTSSAGDIQIAYTTSQGVYKAYGAKDLNLLDKLYSPRPKPVTVIETEHGGKYLEFIIKEATSSFPQIVSTLSVDATNPDQLHFVAVLMGYYCTLDRVL